MCVIASVAGAYILYVACTVRVKNVLKYIRTAACMCTSRLHIYTMKHKYFISSIIHHDYEEFYL